MKINILSILTVTVLLCACGSNSDGTYSSTNGYGSNTNNSSSTSAGGSSQKNSTAAVVPESVLPVKVNNAPKGPAAYAIFENLNNPQDIQKSKENFTTSQLSKQLQKPVYSSPKTVTSTQPEVKQ